MARFLTYSTYDNQDVRTIYDPVNKTPCQASCWMQFNY